MSHTRVHAVRTRVMATPLPAILFLRCDVTRNAHATCSRKDALNVAVFDGSANTRRSRVPVFLLGCSSFILRNKGYKKVTSLYSNCLFMLEMRFMYRVVRDYFLRPLILKFHNLAQLICNFCPICI